jgi:hypothetical protein
VKLTECERILIARRAAGEYGVVSAVRRIVDAHKKNRNPDDAIFLEFSRLIFQKSWRNEDYERLQRSVLAVIPEPWGPPFWKREPKPEPAGTTRKKRRIVKCGLCSGEGHNARTCPSKPSTPTATYTDGIERLAPGFDPNPPEVEESND